MRVGVEYVIVTPWRCGWIGPAAQHPYICPEPHHWVVIHLLALVLRMVDPNAICRSAPPDLSHPTIHYMTYFIGT